MTLPLSPGKRGKKEIKSFIPASSLFASAESKLSNALFTLLTH